MDNQEAYDRIVEYFTRPDAKLGLSDAGKCVYRGQDGQRCAAGCLIPDEAYDPSFEYKTFFSISCSPGLLDAMGINYDTATFIDQCQSAHDAADDLDAFLSDLDRVAKEFELQVRADV